jgi:hypothetical protein
MVCNMEPVFRMSGEVVRHFQKRGNVRRKGLADKDTGLIANESQIPRVVESGRVAIRDILLRTHQRIGNGTLSRKICCRNTLQP